MLGVILIDIGLLQISDGLGRAFRFPCIIYHTEAQTSGSDFSPDRGGLGKGVAWDEDSSQFHSICVHSSNDLIAE